MTDPPKEPGSAETVSTLWRINSVISRRTVGAAMFVGGLIVSGA
jgi:hypothetical protein